MTGVQTCALPIFKGDTGATGVQGVAGAQGAAGISKAGIYQISNATLEANSGSQVSLQLSLNAITGLSANKFYFFQFILHGKQSNVSVRPYALEIAKTGTLTLVSDWKMFDGSYNSSVSTSQPEITFSGFGTIDTGSLGGNLVLIVKDLDAGTYLNPMNLGGSVLLSEVGALG